MKVIVDANKITVTLDIFTDPYDRARKEELRNLHLFRWNRSKSVWEAKYDPAILAQLIDTFGEEALHTDASTKKLFRKVKAAEQSRLALRENFRKLKEEKTVELEDYRFDVAPFGNHQSKALTCLKHTNVAALFFEPGLGKGLLPSENVRTPEGWTPIGDLQVGDLVATSDGSFTEVTGVFPQPRQPVVKITFTDNTAVVCDLSHLWAVKSKYDCWKNKPWRVLSTAKLLETPVRKKRHATGESAGYTWKVPLPSPIQGDPDFSPPVDPYIVGILLGDGSLSQGQPVFHTTTSYIPEKVRDLLPGELTLSKIISPGKTPTYRICLSNSPSKRENPVTAWLKQVALAGTRSYEKFIPREYLEKCGVNSRLDLLRGLLDSDGESSPSHVQYTTASVRLAEDVAELVRSLGGTAKVSGRRMLPTYSYRGRKNGGRPSFKVQIRLDPSIGNIFSLPRKAQTYGERDIAPPCKKIVSIEPHGEAETVCISVAHPSQLFITTGYTVTHNTYTSLMWLRYLRDNRHSDLKTLVVAPLNTLYSAWAEDIQKFCPEFKYVVFNETTKKARQALEEDNADVYLLNFDKLRILKKELLEMNFDAMIIDESVKISNSRTKTTKAAWEVGDTATYRLILSGLPAPNTELEYWSQMRFLSKRAFGMSFLDFRNRHFIPSGFGGFTWKLNPLLRDSFEDRLKDYAIRAREEDYLDLPPTMTHRLKVILPKKVSELYEEYYKRSCAEIEVVQYDLETGVLDSTPELWISRMILDKLIKVRQICGGFLMKREKVWDDVKNKIVTKETIRDIHSEKVKAVEGLLQEIGSQPVLLWAQYQYEFEMLKQAFPDILVINSSVPQKEKERRLQQFKEAPETEKILMVAHPKSIAHGLTFVNCCYTIWYSLDWSVDAHYQANKRVHRIGQDKPVHYYYLEAQSLGCEPTLDSVIFERLQGKYQTQLELLNRLLELKHDSTA